MAIGDEVILDRLTAREAQLHDQGNALDVKASILLVAVTFLAGQTTYLLTKHSGGFWRWEQFLGGLILLVAAGILAVMLRIRSYDGECAEDYLDWRDKVIPHFEGNDSQITQHLVTGIVAGCKARIEKARTINGRKAGQVQAVYVLTLVAFVFNLAALLAPFF